MKRTPSPPWCPVSPGEKLFWRVADPFSPCYSAVPGIGIGEEVPFPPTAVRKALEGEWCAILERDDPFADYKLSRRELVAHLESLVRKGWRLVVPPSSIAYKEQKKGAGYITSPSLLWVLDKSLA